jgi:hypothetical protein
VIGSLPELHTIYTGYRPDNGGTAQCRVLHPHEHPDLQHRGHIPLEISQARTERWCSSDLEVSGYCDLNTATPTPSWEYLHLAYTFVYTCWVQVVGHLGSHCSQGLRKSLFAGIVTGSAINLCAFRNIMGILILCAEMESGDRQASEPGSASAQRRPSKSGVNQV